LGYVFLNNPNEIKGLKTILPGKYSFPGYRTGSKKDIYVFFWVYFYIFVEIMNSLCLKVNFGVEIILSTASRDHRSQ
jgi:hypothetical protein